MIRISDQFEISFDTNEIIIMTDNNDSSRIKVEPRIMQVLEILIKNSPDVVLREELIAQVWDNYGGADDALNQTISHLRKMLKDKDKDKRIIETVVKKGYRFVGLIEHLPSKQNQPYWRQQTLQFWFVLATAILLCIALIIFAMSNQVPNNSNDSWAPEAPVSHEKILDSENSNAPKVDKDEN